MARINSVWKRRFTFVQGKSNKFWEAEVLDKRLIVRYGRIGTIGQTMFEDFGTFDAAINAAQKKCNEKIKKGYKEVGKSVVPLAEERLPLNQGKALAQEAVQLFLEQNPKNRPTTSANKRKANSKPSESVSTPSSSDLQNSEKTRPKRKVRI